MRTRWVLILCALVATASVGLVGCGSSPSIPRLAAGGQYYVSLGDSYATGYQALGPHKSGNTRNGFAYQIPALAMAKGYRLTLVNFGCAGATTSTVLTRKGCPAGSLGPGSPGYPGGTTQIQAATAFLRAHQGHVGLITVSIGGNDVIPCAAAPQPIPCVTTAMSKLKANLDSIVTQLRSAAGAGVPIVGTTYPDVLLAEDLSSTPSQRQLAGLSVVAFRSLLNPTLRAAYQSVGASFVDVTAASGAYGPLSATTLLPPYGNIPVPVAQVCQLTFMCQYQNIHPTTAGYTLIANLVVGVLPPRG